MSIMKDYEKARESIGKEKYDAIEKYIDEICPRSIFRKYEKELNNLVCLDPQEWAKQKKKLEEKYEIVFLSDILYNPEEWNKFESWYKQKSKTYIIEMWETNADRNDGFGQIIEEDIENLGQAIKKAKEIFETSECVSIEVQKSISREAVYFRDKVEEKFFIETKEIQEEEQNDERNNKVIRSNIEQVAVKSGYYFEIFDKKDLPDELKKANYKVELNGVIFDLYEGNTLEQERLIDSMFRDNMGHFIDDHKISIQEEEELDEPG